MTDTLIPIDEVINRSRSLGVTYSGSPKVHLAYLTKIGLLPKTIRRKIENVITGCYPVEALTRLKDIENFKNQGLTYTQIKYILSENTAISYPVANSSPHQLLYLLAGLILGYFLSVVSLNSNRATISPIDKQATPLLSLKSNENSDNPVYVIAIPNQNFAKLGHNTINIDTIK